MPKVFIKCPKTGKPTPTKINVPKGSNLSVFKNNKVKCEHCFEIHTWTAADGFFLDEGTSTT